MWLFTGNVRLKTVRPYARPYARPYVRVCVCACVRVCIYIVYLPSPFVFLLKIMFCNLFVNQSFMKKF